MLTFTVIDPHTGEYPNLEAIVRHEVWAARLLYCDVDGFYVGEEGELILLDDCNRVAYPPPGRFIVKWGENI